MSMLPDKYDPSSEGPKNEYLHEDPDFQLTYPAIFEYLCRCAYKGRRRETSRLVIYYEDGQCTILLTDPHSAKILFHGCQAVEEGLASLNERLSAETVRGWKKDKKARLR